MEIVGSWQGKNAANGLVSGTRQQRTNRACFGFPIQARGEQRHGVGRYFGFGFKEQEIFADSGPDTDIQRLGGAEISRQPQDGNVWKVGVERRAAIGGTVVDQNDLHQLAVARFLERGERAAERGGLIIRDDQR